MTAAELIEQLQRFIAENPEVEQYNVYTEEFRIIKTDKVIVSNRFKCIKLKDLSYDQE